jgi:choline kinase
MSAIETAIILAAGAGSRLQGRGASKPLCEVAGRPLVDHALLGLAEAGIARAIVVTGFGAEAVEAHLAGGSWPIEVLAARTPDWRLPNGVSARAAAPLAGEGPALLVMCDHLVQPELYARVREAAEDGGLRLGIDRRLGHAWVDPEDVTCVRTEGGRIVAIGKGLEPHDAYDTGVFAVGPNFFAVLESLVSPSLTEAVALLAARGAAATVDCSDLDWIDVDDPAALDKAEKAARNGRF